MQNGLSNREIMHFICTFIAILLGISVHGQFLRMKRQEGVQIKAHGWLQSNRNTKIGKKASSPVYPDLYITTLALAAGKTCFWQFVLVNTVS